MSETSNLSVLSGVNAQYIANLYGQYLSNASSVNASWKSLFDSLDDNETELLNELVGASWTPEENRKTGGKTLPANDFDHSAAEKKTDAKTVKTVPVAGQNVEESTLDSIRALMLIRSYRTRGHLEANLDPLGLRESGDHPELDPSHFGFTSADYNRKIFLNNVLGLEYATLKEILDTLKKTYCGTIGVEFTHLSDPKEKAWIQERIESRKNQTEFTINGKRAILQRLTAAEVFETFLHTKYQGTKRFGLDGGESVIPAIEQIMKRGGQLGLKEIVIGMAHRGRLNVLTNVMGKSFTAVFSEFQGESNNPDNVQGSGDVKYHLGTSGDRDFDGNEIHLSLTANPSHLEAVNPVVIGKVRAKQVQREDKTATQVMPLLLHGDAAFAGQGLVAETLLISELPGYRVGGTIHIIINNQIGFTTTPRYGRSGPHPTDVAKMLSAPIFHVNCDDPEAVVHASRIAIEFRQEFNKDVVLDLYCYRRHGHNEGDEPMFTQPLMYQKIANQKTTRELYGEQLIREKVLLPEEVEAITNEFKDYLEEAYQATKSYKPNKADFLEGAWSGFKVAYGEERRGTTAISEDRLKDLGKKLTSLPSDFHLHSKIKRIVGNRAKMFKGDMSFDWATAESLAFASLLTEDFSVRLSGQDCGRGTFSQRHATLYDQENGSKYYPLANLEKDQGRFEVHDSPLSEAAVLGFEYGYSLAEPRTLTLWEAQFGDFVNSAQVHIDQFISSGELKWLRMSGLVMLLPHGYEGQGPEHSSAKPERFLQLCAEDNWQVANCTTPAQYFHILRRQLHRDFRKPLIMMTPKSLLRHKLAVSEIDMFVGDSTFHRFLWDGNIDNLVTAKKMKRVILCSGKVYYDLFQRREELGIEDVMILRLEQLYPFAYKGLEEELAKYPNAEIVWCQEEPKNMGYWSFVHEPIEDVLTTIKHKAGRPRYVGRPASASPASGLLRHHNEQQAKLVEEALTI